MCNHGMLKFFHFLGDCTQVFLFTLLIMQALLQNSTDAMKESRTIEILNAVWNTEFIDTLFPPHFGCIWHIWFSVSFYACNHLQLEPLAYRRMDFEEFRAATVSPYQLEAVARWEEIASTAFEYFEQEGNRVITIEELAQVCDRIILSMNWTFCLTKILMKSPPLLLTYRRWIFLQRRIPSSVTGLDRRMASLAF